MYAKMLEGENVLLNFSFYYRKLKAKLVVIGRQTSQDVGKLMTFLFIAILV